MYDKCLEEGDYQLTAQGNMRTPSRKYIDEQVLEDWRKLLDGLSRKSCKMCGLSGALDSYEDDQIMCIKYGPCKDLLARLQGLEESDIDPFEAIPDDGFCGEMLQI